MKCFERLKAKATQIGVSLDDTCEYDVILDAPPGYVWRANGCTCLSEPAATNSQTWYAQACVAIDKRASMGLEKVKDKEEVKRIQFEMDDESWGAPENAPDLIEWP